MSRDTSFQEDLHFFLQHLSNFQYSQDRIQIHLLIFNLKFLKMLISQLQYFLQ